MTAKIHIKEQDDWIEIYIDGELKYENHSIRWEKLLDLLDIEYTSEYIEGE